MRKFIQHLAGAFRSSRWDIMFVLVVLLYLTIAVSNFIKGWYDNDLNQFIMVGIASTGAFTVELTYMFNKKRRIRIERLGIFGALSLSMTFLIVGSFI